MSTHLQYDNTKLYSHGQPRQQLEARTERFEIDKCSMEVNICSLLTRFDSFAFSFYCIFIERLKNNDQNQCSRGRNSLTLSL